MSLFDTLRYSLSDPPTIEELNSLSTELQTELIKLYLTEFPSDAAAQYNWNLLHSRIRKTLWLCHVMDYSEYNRIMPELRKYIKEL